MTLRKMLKCRDSADERGDGMDSCIIPISIRWNESDFQMLFSLDF
jgi:hypothetical protein